MGFAIETLALALALGVLAGALTTVAGLGGGILLVVALSLVWPPATALAVTALALFASNAHRVYLFRAAVDRPAARLLVAGIVPGALAGGLVATAVPAIVLRVAIAAVVVLAIARGLLGWRWSVPRAVLIPAGVAVGFLTATAGGAGVLLAPLAIAAGLAGERYVATVALAACACHVGRIVGYAAGGLVDGRVALLAAMLAVALMTGNLVGRAARTRLTAPATRRIEYVTLTVCAVLAIAGIA